MQKPILIGASFFLFLVFLAALLFIPFLGNVHLFDWDEINFAEISREMVVTDSYSQPQINFQSFTEKPPLYFWLQAISMNLFGINEFSARLPNALLGMLVLPVLFLTGRKLKDNSFGFLWAIIYTCTILPHLYFKSGIIDPWFNFFIFLSIYGLIMAADKRREKQSNIIWLIFGGAMSGLAILTKGPVALVLIGLTFAVYWAFNRFRWFISLPQLFVFIISALVIAGLWLGNDYLQHGDKFLKEFTVRQWELLTTADAGHRGFLFYHFVVLFFGCFPASAFFIHALIKKHSEDKRFTDFKKWMVVFFCVVLFVFTLVQTKIVHYSSLCYYPISFLAAVSLYNIISKKWILDGWVKILIIVSAFPFILAPFAAAYFGQNMSQLKPLLKQDAFATENIQAQVQWSGWEFLPGLILAVAIVLSFVYFKRQKNQRAVYTLLTGSAIFIQSGLFFLVGRIEAISQRANIDFWQAHANEDCYMVPYRYKTYTHYFYGIMKPQFNINYTNNDWLLKGNIDNPVYISCKVTSKEALEKELPDALFLYSKNGFYFYKRTPQLK